MDKDLDEDATVVEGKGEGVEVEGRVLLQIKVVLTDEGAAVLEAMEEDPPDPAVPSGWPAGSKKYPNRFSWAFPHHSSPVPGQSVLHEYVSS